MVKCLCLKPCWCGGMIMLLVMCGRMIFSSVFAMGESSAMGLNDVPWVVSLPGLGIGIILAIFHVCGIVFVLRGRLKIAVRYVSAVTPRCLKCLIFVLSGPVELLFSACFIPSEVCSIVICMGVDFSLLVNLSMILYLRCVVCFTWFVHCLLKCSAFCFSVVAVLLSKVIAMLGVCGGFLCARPFKVFQSVWEFVLWSQLFVRCCFQSACLWFCISLSMFAFCCVRSGSLGFCCLVVLRCFIIFLMCSGSSFCVWCIFPFGI